MHRIACGIQNFAKVLRGVDHIADAIEFDFTYAGGPDDEDDDEDDELSGSEGGSVLDSTVEGAKVCNTGCNCVGKVPLTR